MAGRDGTDEMRAFVSRHSLGFVPHTVDDDGSLWASFGVRVQPAWVFIDRTGETTVAFGPQSVRELRDRLDEIEGS